jgi:hypothetical protein
VIVVIRPEKAPLLARVRSARQERLRQERMAVYGAFAGAVTDHRRAVVNLWFRRGAGPDDPGYRAAREECDRLGAALDHATTTGQFVARSRQHGRASSRRRRQRPGDNRPYHHPGRSPTVGCHVRTAAR